MSETAVERASKMMFIPMSQLPVLALEFVQELSRQHGICGEIYMTAFAAYAQCVEGLSCDDDLYMVSSDDRRWFLERISQRKLPNDSN